MILCAATANQDQAPRCAGCAFWRQGDPEHGGAAGFCHSPRGPYRGKLLSFAASCAFHAPETGAS